MFDPMIRRLHYVIAAISAFLSAATPTFACAVCGGDTNSDMVKGALSGVVAMVAITYGVLFCFAAMMLACFVRARRLARAGGQGRDGGDSARP